MEHKTKQGRKAEAKRCIKKGEISQTADMKTAEREKSLNKTYTLKKVRVRTGERAPDDRENAFPIRIGEGR